MENKRYSDEELLGRIWDTEDIKKLVYKRAIYVTNEWRRQELEELWVSDPALQATASFGRNTGWYVGMDAIRGYYVEQHQRDRQAQLDALCAADPAIENCPANLGLGCASTHTPSTGYVHIAGDGKTARAMFYSLAQETTAQPDGTALALWVPEKQAFDLVREADGWKIWHMVLATDITLEAGTNFEDHGPYADYDHDPVMQEFGTPTVPCICHDSTFNWWDNYPPIPQPYETYTDAESYAPAGYKGPEYFTWRAGEGGYN